MENERELEIVLEMDRIAFKTGSIETAIRTVWKEVKKEGFGYMDLYRLSFETDFKEVQKENVKKEIEQEKKNGTLMQKMKGFDFNTCIK